MEDRGQTEPQLSPDRYAGQDGTGRTGHTPAEDPVQTSSLSFQTQSNGSEDGVDESGCTSLTLFECQYLLWGSVPCLAIHPPTQSPIVPRWMAPRVMNIINNKWGRAFSI